MLSKRCILMSIKFLHHCPHLLYSIFFTAFFFGEQQVLASDKAVLSIKARMKIIRNVSVSYDDHFIGNPFNVEAKGMKLENLINVKISYNGYRPIKLILKQKKQSDSDEENFAFYHELEKSTRKSNTLYTSAKLNSL